ncbi:hypothetical protein LTR66_014143, partial [Elasticomyces elasticus]
MIEMDTLRLYLAPSMLADMRKGNFTGFEDIPGDPLMEGEKIGVPMSMLRVLYGLCHAYQ